MDLIVLQFLDFKKNGFFILENHYLLDVIKKNQFDTFYHEHLRTYSLKSLIKFLFRLQSFSSIFKLA